MHLCPSSGAVNLKLQIVASSPNAQSYDCLEVGSNLKEGGGKTPQFGGQDTPQTSPFKLEKTSFRRQHETDGSWQPS
jgi:hypothetical protein